MAISNSGNSTDVSFLRPLSTATPGRDQSSTTSAGSTSPTSSPQESERSENNPATGGLTPASTTDEVRISAAAQELNRAPDSDPRASFDSARVSEIRAAIEAGEYPLNSTKLADSILRLEQELGL